MSRAIEAILGGPVVPLHVGLVKPCGGINAAIFVRQALYWQRKVQRPFWKTQEQWEAETGLTRREQETARKNLTKRGILREERRDLPAKLYFWVDLAALEAAILGCPDAPNTDGADVGKDGGTRQTLMAEPATHQETTQETTQKTTQMAESLFPYIEDERPKLLKKDGTLTAKGESLFDAWWAIYPKREKKPYAKRKWGAAAEKLGPDELLRLTREWLERNRDTPLKYIPHPGTWLNNERWTDEPSGKRGEPAAQDDDDWLDAHSRATEDRYGS